MAEATLATPPAAPAAPVVSTATPVAPTPAPVGSIPAPVEPVAPKPGSARERMRQELGKITKPANGAAEPKPQVVPVPAKAGDAPPADGAVPPVVSDDGKKGKVSPWKLVDEWKAKTTQLESQLAELKKGSVDPEERKQLSERMTKAETRAKELEDHIRYVDYSKSTEYADKYQKPYERAWEKAVGELKEITITDPATNQERAVSTQDLLDLVNLPLGKARQIADEVFGAFSDDMMAHRKEIRALFDSQQQALEEAKKNGAQRTEAQTKEVAESQAKMAQTIKETWENENKSVLADATFGKLFTPKEGDEQWNTRLQRGFELVDKAFSENPTDPKLNSEDRAAIIRRHAAVRNRAAAWGALRYENEQLTAKLVAMEKEIAEYKGSEPSSGGGRPQGQTQAPVSARAGMMAELRKRAK